MKSPTETPRGGGGGYASFSLPPYQVATTHQGSFLHVLKGTQPLRKTLSLRQLVPVYRAVLQTAASQDDDSGDNHDDQHPASYLLKIQWLAQRIVVEEAHAPLAALALLVFPGLPTDDDDDLVEAVLDALLPPETPSNVEKNNENVWLEYCVSILLNVLSSSSTPQWPPEFASYFSSSTPSPLSWKTSCHILGRLAGVYGIQDALLERIVQCVTTASGEENAVAAWVSPVVRHILPALSHCISHELWSAFQASTSPVVVTTFLCALLPQQKDKYKNEPWLWDLLYQCVCCSTAGHSSDDLLLRRRGLFLLDHCTEDKSCWKDYVACFQTLVMESATHLHVQLWSMMGELMMAPTIPWKWMEPLLRWCILEHPMPLTRKLALCRFLEREFVQTIPDVSFWTSAVLPAVDSLVGVVGLRFAAHQKEDKDLLEKMQDAICEVFSLLLQDKQQPAAAWDTFLTSVWSLELRDKTSCALHIAVKRAWEQQQQQLDNNENQASPFHMHEEFLQTVLKTWTRCEAIYPLDFLHIMLESLALTLAHSTTTAKNTINPRTLLEVVAIFADHPGTDDQLKQWLQTHHSLIAPAIPAAFVDGYILGSGGAETTTDAKHGYTTALERKIAAAVVHAVVLIAPDTASVLLWPAIHKGLSQVTAVNKQARAQLLLQHGCQRQVLSGMGNGGLVMTANREVMMPPPPGIETLLFTSFRFCEQTIRSVVSSEETRKTKLRSSSIRSDDVRIRTETLKRQVEQLKIVVESFPSSEAIGSALQEMSTESQKQPDSPMQVALLYASLACGGKIASSSQAIVSLLDMTTPRRVSGAVRSIFQVVKWKSLALLLPQASSQAENDAGWAEKLHEAALDAVDSAPADALLAVFDCMKGSADLQVSASNQAPLNKCIDGFFALLSETKKSKDVLYLVDGFCCFLFQPALLVAETNTATATPIRDTFRRLIDMAGCNRPYISRAVLSRMCAVWVSNEAEVLRSAVLYRDDILELLLKKEDKVKLSGKSKADLVENENGGLGDETSVSRFFILVMISKLPDDMDALPREFVTGVLHFLIKSLLAIATAEYCRKIRALQSLCILSRFVTPDIAEHVAQRIFHAIGKQNPHQQARYFVEVFALQCAKKHPTVFAPVLAAQLARTNMWPHEVASILVIVGNLTVGRFASEFLAESVFDAHQIHDLRKKILAGVVRWLSSTQSFARGISQLLAFKLIPQVADVDSTPNTSDSSWYLISVYDYLLENSDAIRLREKQLDFFESFDIEAACSPYDLSTFPVDLSGEVCPKTMVECISNCLKELVQSSDDLYQNYWNDKDHPEEDGSEEPASFPNGNLQRKIIPIDSLNMALETAKEQRLRNYADRRKQDLIVCASLVEKLPNLGGLCRTAEIFAAQRLVIPDKKFISDATFTSLSVGAADWIDIEECKEKDLLSWLRNRRKEGYLIIGLEQTSSSVSLEQYNFPNKPTVLLLGKEREGIPVEYLQSVDRCLEIPQLGIIRSLNVHVSGAIAIWEFSRQRVASTSGDPANSPSTKSL